MEKEMNEERLLGAQEILFYAMNEASPKHFLVAAEIEGPTTLKCWELAVRSLQKAHPMLGNSITARGNDLFFTKTAITLQLKSTPLTPAFDLTRALEEELELGFRSHQGPLARVRLYHAADKCVVVIAAHHSISDALSAVALINDLTGLLSGQQIASLSMQPSVDEFLGFTNQELAKKINEQITPGVALPHQFLQQHPPAKVDVLHLSADLTRKLTNTAKSNGTTVHGALQASAALSLRELAFEQDRPAYIMSPFSVRNEMHIGSDCGLFIDTKIVAVATDQDFWEIARSATAELSNVHSQEFLKSSAEQLRGLISSSDDLIQFIKDHFNFDIMLSNLGRVQLINSSPELQVNYIAGPFIISGLNNQQAIGAVTCHGRLTLTNSSRYPVAGLLSMIERKIDAVCS